MSDKYAYIKYISKDQGISIKQATDYYNEVFNMCIDYKVVV